MKWSAENYELTFDKLSIVIFVILNLSRNQ
jgi:hypothetical protein